MESVISDGMCRCCATEGNFKDFQVSFLWMGVEEIYGNMLKECFDITLLVSEEVNNGGICEVCITQLRNAYNFKRQVQATEDKFRKIIDERAFKTDEIKMEVTRFDDEDSNNSADDFSSQEYEVPIKEEKVEDKPKKRAARASTSKAKKSKTAVGETSTKRKHPDKEYEDLRSEIIVTIKRLSEEDETDDVIDKDNIIEHDVEKLPTDMEKLSGKKKNIKLKPIKELSKHHNNIKEILQCSNATPIHGKSDIGYMCCYCSDQYPNPADLKAHTLDKHIDADDADATFLRKRDLKKYNVKVDITGLKCKTCSKPLHNLDDLIDHLIKDHKRKIYTDVKNHIIPFKFESGDLKCFLCANVYTKFKVLLEHMHRHCRNFECDVCGASFFNRRSLLNHDKTHDVGEFECEHCDKVFDNVQKKNSHVRIVHVHGYLLNKCGFCNKKFSGYRMKAEHLKTIHGIGKEPVECQACDKTFSNKDSLRKHTKRHHLMESRYSCSECDMKFYSSKDLSKHTVKHTKTRSFECKVCSKRYGRQHTLREHMRIHENDRRFKCDHCGVAFVQKCSLQRHVVTKHRGKVSSLVD